MRKNYTDGYEKYYIKNFRKHLEEPEKEEVKSDCKTVTHNDYYVNRSMSKGKVDNNESLENTDEHMPEIDEKSQKKSQKNHVFNLILILLCFAVTFVLTDFFSHGYLSNELMSMAKPKLRGTYYAVQATEILDKDDALKKSFTVRQGGGGGNICQTKKGFSVVYSVYPDKKEADMVASKNEGTVVVKYEISDFDHANTTPVMDKIGKEFVSLCVETLDFVITYTQKEPQQVNDAKQTYPAVTPYRNKFLKMKTDILNAKDDGATKSQLLMTAEKIFGLTDSLLSSSPSRTNLLSDLRFVMFATIEELQSLNNNKA